VNVQLRKLRGVLSIGVAWGAAWATIFAALGLVIKIFRPEIIGPGEGPIRIGAILGGVGGMAGIGFAILLSFAESGKPIRAISLSRAAMWGVLASAVFPILSGRQDQVLVLCPTGAILAVVGLTIARKAERDNSRQPQHPRNVFGGYVLTSLQDTISLPMESRS
jgi:hypothetical protein